MRMQQGRNEHGPGAEQVGLHLFLSVNTCATEEQNTATYQAYVLSPRRQRQRQDLTKKFVGVMAVVEK